MSPRIPTSSVCSGCGKPEPADYCWDGLDWHCPLGYPPRWVTGTPSELAIRKLWEEVRDLRDAFNELPGV